MSSPVARSGLPLNLSISRSASALPNGINGRQRPDIVPGPLVYGDILAIPVLS